LLSACRPRRPPLLSEPEHYATSSAWKRAPLVRASAASRQGAAVPLAGGSASAPVAPARRFSHAKATLSLPHLGAGAPGWAR
jgi:hypothetical protein